ncbi:hypothetical protein J1N35_038707 [Gossypium stocksii]|uniref:DUF4283 domain-containing protein n=1 Tax=Gossypium stocksii TaxID=47602 RepID=A0A9D3UMD1_9ROSI|nr:hypothetical protein J1N35_038707 [Gossypium stocksii]
MACLLLTFRIGFSKVLSWAFDSSQADPGVVMAWIRFPSLPSYLYIHKIITKIGELVGKVVKLDMNTDSRARGCFARLAIYVNIDKPLVLQILMNGQLQKVEYESLMTICFHCGRYQHVENMCPFSITRPSVEKKSNSSEKIPKNSNPVKEDSERKDENFRPWMIVERKSRWKVRDNGQNSAGIQRKEKEGSHSFSLNNRDLNKRFPDEVSNDF